MKKIHYTISPFLALLFFTFLSIAGINLHIASYGKWSSSTIEALPQSYCALLLGTSKWKVGGGKNLFYQYRIEAAARLYKADKVEKIVVSGSNRTTKYNEPRDMRKDLIAKGVAAKDIISDYAGLRTLDSVIRFHKIFGQREGIVISQKFHNSRAIYIARKNGIMLYGYNAEDVPFRYRIKVMVREVFAKCVCFFDVNLLNTAPHYLGEKIIIEKEKEIIKKAGGSENGEGKEKSRKCP